MEIFGHNGKLLRVDLSLGKIETEEIPEKLFRKYLGGGALGLYYLLRETTPKKDPLDEESPLIFMASAVTGTPALGFSRYSVLAKSPQSGGFGESEAGGWWGPELKRAGFDGIIVKGRAEKPVYLFLKEGKAEIKDASKVWGLYAKETEEKIREEISEPKARVLLIGPGGEKLVKYACILNDLRHANGRCGMGAVMGSKNLKAIAVKGGGQLPLYDKEGVNTLVKDLAARFKENPGTMTQLGTARGIRGGNAAGTLPTNNFREGTFKSFEEISAEKMIDSILTGRGTCYGCYIRCKREVTVDSSGVIPEYGGPEYETIAAFGSGLKIFDLPAIAYVNQLCQQYTVDTISLGVIVGFIMECYETGALTEEDLGGLKARFGNSEDMIALVKATLTRTGIGDLIAEGMEAVIHRFGEKCRPYAMQVKGIPVPMHEPRGKNSLSLAYAVSASGPDHMEVQHDPVFETEGGLSIYQGLGFTDTLSSYSLAASKVRQFFYLQTLYSFYNSIGLCCFCARPVGPITIFDVVKYVRLVTGWDTNLWEMMKVGEKHGLMARVFNLREGLGLKSDSLPERFFEPLGGEGPAAGKALKREEFEEARETYYGMMGWDEKGIPRTWKMAELDLLWVQDLASEVFEEKERVRG